MLMSIFELSTFAYSAQLGANEVFSNLIINIEKRTTEI